MLYFLILEIGFDTLQRGDFSLMTARKNADCCEQFAADTLERHGDVRGTVPDDVAKPMTPVKVQSVKLDWLSLHTVP